MMKFITLADYEGGPVIVQLDYLEAIEPLHHVSPGDQCRTQLTMASGKTIRVRESSDEIRTAIESAR